MRLQTSEERYLLENARRELRDEEVQEVGRLLKEFRELLAHALLKALGAFVRDAIPLLGLRSKMRMR